MIKGSDIVKSIRKDLNEMNEYKRTGRASSITVMARFALDTSRMQAEQRHVLVEKDFTGPRNI